MCNWELVPFRPNELYECIPITNVDSIRNIKYGSWEQCYKNGIHIFPQLFTIAIKSDFIVNWQFFLKPYWAKYSKANQINIEHACLTYVSKLKKQKSIIFPAPRIFD